jgi:serine/threonine-protein kinase
LVYVRSGTLFAVPFDLDKLEVQGLAVPVLEQVAYSDLNGAAQFDVSRNGTLIYTSGAGGLGQMNIQWMEEGGRTTPLLSKPGLYLWPDVSPDGTRLALTVVEEDGPRVAVYHPARDTLQPIAFDGGSASGPIWTPDGQFLLFWAEGGIYSVRPDGGRAELFSQAKGLRYPVSFPRDGKMLAFIQQSSPGVFRPWIMPIDYSGGRIQAGAAELLVNAPGNTFYPRLSPDGRWLAEGSSRSGTFEVYVQAYPDTGASWKVSEAGGTAPFWSANGRELFFRTLDHRIMVASYSINGRIFAADKPRLWSAKPMADTGNFPNFDLAPDGRRFAVLMPVEEPNGRNLVTFRMNFFEEIRRRLARAGAQ